MFRQKKYKYKEGDRLDNLLINLIEEESYYNNEYSYQKLMLCMIRLSGFFKENISPLLKNKLIIAEEYWTGFIPFINFPTTEIDEEFKELYKIINFEKTDTIQLHIRAVRLLFEKYNAESVDENIEVFLLFVEYLMKLGFYKEDIADVIENLFD